MLKRLSLIALLMVLLVSPTWTEPWGGRAITVAAGTAVRVVGVRTISSSLFFQMKEGCSSCGVGYILYAPPDVSCANGGAGTTLIATLAAATSTAPGGNAVIPSNPDPQGGVDIRGYCVDGSHTADVITVSWNIRN